MFNEKNAKYFDLFNQIYYVYFLLKDGNVVYVGQTDNILNRIKSHQKNKNFNNVAYITTTKDKLNYLENYYIMKYEPFYNKLSTDYRCMSSAYIIKKIREKYNQEEASFEEIIHFIEKSKYKDILNRKNCIVIKKEYSNLINEIEDYFVKKGE